MAESQLIAKVRRGDRRAQAALYNRFAPYSLAIIRRYGIASATESDVLQTIFIEVFQRIDHFDEKKGNFKTWLKQITVFRVIDQQRKATRLVFDEIPTTLPSDQGIEWAQLETSYLLRLIDKLPTGFRTVFNLYAIEGYDHTEIGILLDISPGTSRSQYHRARQLLQAALKKTHKVTTDEAA